MKVLLINTSERIGGAAVACSRLMDALNNNGIKAKMLVRDKQTDRISVCTVRQGWHTKWNFLWERFCIWINNRLSRKYLFDIDIANTGSDITQLPEFQEADIIHLHWINQGMMSLRELQKILASGKPVVWTMHDMWPITGVCHHARECTQFEKACRNCPYIGNGSIKNDLSQRTFRKKKAVYQEGKISFVACSQWLGELARKSNLTQGHTVYTVPNPLPTHLFHPGDRQEARQRLGLPQEGRLILFGSVKITDKRKGIDYLVEACRLLAEKYPELTETLGIAVMGNGSEELKPLLPFKVYALNYVSDEHRLVDIYHATNLYVTPSLQENLPNTIMEAMGCGIPCVGFHIGGIPEMIDHEVNGYVAQYCSAEDLAHGIHWVLTNDNYSTLCQAAARKAVTHYSESMVAKRYIEIYNQA